MKRGMKLLALSIKCLCMAMKKEVDEEVVATVVAVTNIHSNRLA